MVRKPSGGQNNMGGNKNAALSDHQTETKTKALELLKILKRGAQFTEELMEENERLRFRLVQMESENQALARQIMASHSFDELLVKINAMEEEKSSLLNRFQEVESENQDFKERYNEIEEENNRLANLYIASFQLHSTHDIKEVVRITFEILINLVGTRDFALYLKDGSRLMPVMSEGREVEKLPPITLGKGVAGRSAQEGSLAISANQMTQASISQPKVCIPIQVESGLVGMFVIYSFLAQKASITELDRELFKLLGGHAAMALYSSRLHMIAAQNQDQALSYIQLLNS